MNHCPLVHILLPVFNHKKYLLDSINSVLNQSYQNIKLIILDDGSTEDLSEIFKLFSSHEKIEILSQKNLGLPAALTKLYKTSLNSHPFPTYITWHSADNLYSDDAIEKLVQFLEKYPNFDLAYANVRLIDSNGRPVINSNYRVDDQMVEDTSILNLDYCFDSISQFNDNFVNACFLTRSRIEAILPSFENLNRGFEDYVHLLQLSIISKGSHIGIKDALYSYRLHEESLTSSLNSNTLFDSQKELVERTNFIVQELAHDNVLFSLTSNSTKKSFSLNTIIDELKNKIEDSDICIKPALNLAQSKIIPSLKLAEIRITKVHGFVHESHSSIFEIPPLNVSYGMKDSPAIREMLFTGTANLPKTLTRARNRNLKMFDCESKYLQKLLLFTPSKSDQYLINNITDFIKYNEEKLIVLLCQSNDEKAVADQIYLNSDCAKNLRIVQIEKDEQGKIIDANLFLNSLGSIQAIVSILNFTTRTETNENLFHADIVTEFILANLTGRQLIVPKNYLGIRNYQFLNSPLVIESDLQNLTRWEDFNIVKKPILNICDRTLKQFSYPESFSKMIYASFCYSI